MSRLYHTVRHLRWEQVVWRLWYRAYRTHAESRAAPPQRAVAGTWVTPAGRAQSQVGVDSFRFLNQQGRVRQASDWNHPEHNKLWLYNLHYFDDLNAEGAGKRVQWHQRLIQRWIDDNPPGHGNGWEPYPISLRVVNWGKWLLGGWEPPSVAMLDSLACQTRWLRRRLEYHLLGNHLFANAKALVFAGLFFEGDEATEWLAKGRQLLEREIPEQILPDGGHFERSPMYHLIVLEDVLDLINVSRAYGQEIPGVWLDAAGRMLAWSWAMRHPDGEVPFFNDASIGIAPAPTVLDAYARRLGLCAAVPSQELTVLGDAGYVRMNRGRARVFVDAAPVGPDYLPGHAHADSLSFELSLDGRRLCVNSGTSTYEAGELRQWQRSTAAHNTVQVDGADSSEVWAGFRVAHRARARLEQVGRDATELLVRASHNGYRRLPGRPLHRRTWCLKEGMLTVEDEIIGLREHTVESLLHFHPDWQLVLDEKRATVTVRDAADECVAQVQFFGVGALTIATGAWYPRFGEATRNQHCRWRASVRRVPMVFGFEVRWRGEYVGSGHSERGRGG